MRAYIEQKFNLQFEREKIKWDVSVILLSKGNYRGMREELAKIHWKGIVVEMTVEQQWPEFLGPGITKSFIP